MRKIFALIAMVLAFGLSAIASNATPHEAQISQDKINTSYRRMPLVQKGKVLVKQPETNIIPFGVSFASLLEAYLAGYGALTPEVLRSIGGRTVIEVPGANLFNQLSVSTLSYHGREMVIPSIFVKNWEREGLGLQIDGAAMYSYELNEYCEFEIYDFDEKVDADKELPQGEYLTCVYVHIYDEETEQSLGEGLLFGEIDLSETNNVIIVDANELKYTIEVNAYLPDGSSFPSYDIKDPENFDYASIDVSLKMDDWFGYMGLVSNANFYVMYNELPRELSFSKDFIYSNSKNEFYVAHARVCGQYEGNYVYNLPTDLYETYSAGFCLTEQDYEGTEVGAMFEVSSFNPNGCSSSGINIWSDEPASEISLQACFLPNDISTGYYNSLRFGTVIGYDYDTWEAVSKMGGNEIKTSEGILDFYGNSMYMPVTWFPEEIVTVVPETYYTKALYVSGGIYQFCDENDAIIHTIAAAMNVYGPDNECVTGLNAWDYFAGCTRNGETVDIYDILGSTDQDGDLFTYTFNYDNFLVDESIKASTKMTIGFHSFLDEETDGSEPFINY